MSSTFDRFDVMCKQLSETALRPFLIGIKTVTLTVRVNKTKALHLYLLYFVLLVIDISVVIGVCTYLEYQVQEKQQLYTR